MIRPESIVRLCAVPLDATQQHQIKFDSTAAQASYFASCAVRSYTEFTFIRADRSIIVPVNLDDLFTVNYVMYDNGGRWFYAFIEKMEYVNENATRITINGDVFQNWMLNVTMHPSFVEREHVASDAIGEHILEEGLETGEYVANTAELPAGLGIMDIIIAITVDFDHPIDPTYAVGAMYYGVYSGCNFYGTRDAVQASIFIKALIVAKQRDSIIAVFMAPHLITEANEASIALLDLPETGSAIDITTPAEPTSIDGYTPHNNKLLCYPYQYLNVTNNNGSQGIFRWERFQHVTTNKRFAVIGGVAPGATYKLIPKYQTPGGTNYNSFDEALTLGNFPVCCFSGSTFQSYISQSVPGAMLAAASIVGGAVTGNPVAISGGLASALAILGGAAGKAMQPPQVTGNIGSGSANAAVGLNDFIISGRSIRAQYARIIDEFFDMYGYKVARVKVPEVASRPVWNYIKTVDINLTGAIPAGDLAELKNIFNKGVTLWHSGANVGNYALDNTIVGD